MVEHEHTRQIDRWLKWVAVLGPVVGWLLGVPTGVVVAYQAFKQDHNDIVQLQSWKDKQEEFNLETVKAITRLKALIKDIQP